MFTSFRFMSSFRCIYAVAVVFAMAGLAMRISPPADGDLARSFTAAILAGCGALGSYWILASWWDRRKKAPPAPKAYTDQDYKKDLEGIEGQGSLEELLEKWRTTPPPPKPVEKKKDEAQPRVVDPFAGAGVFMGAAAGAAIAAMKRPGRFILRPHGQMLPGDWIRTHPGSTLCKVIGPDEPPFWKVKLQDGTVSRIHEAFLGPAVPRSDEYWKQEICPRHSPEIAWVTRPDTPEEDRRAHKAFALERMRCGCFAPDNFDGSPYARP
jgi:hypothetical protein